MSPVHVRQQLASSIVLDLIGPYGTNGYPSEILSQQPSKWYLTGFLVPTESSETQRIDETVTEQLDQSAVPSNGDEAGNSEPPVARRSYLPSSCGISFLIAAKSTTLQAIVRWGDYERVDKEKPQSPNHWLRKPREQIVDLKVGSDPIASGIENVPNSGGLQVVWNARALNPHHGEDDVPKGTRSISVFLVNRRIPAGDDYADEAFVFQVELEIHGDSPFVPRPNLATLESDEWDQLVADIQYRDTCEFSVGHAISTEAVVEDGHCVIVRTVWIPCSQVERVAPASIRDVELGMDALSEIENGDDAKVKLGPLVNHYRVWIEEQATALEKLSDRRKETCDELLKNARFASKRIELGIELLKDPQCLEAFRIANRAMANQGRRRLALALKKPASEIVPEWRPFQLAFILMNLKGIAEPTHDDRELVDLLFFPTGGGKTEAYLGLAAFTLVLRRLKNPGITSAGLSVLMRYTLRLLTLDQLGRAAALICALELERQNDVNKLGEWPFEIGLWVGKAATPNRMGAKGDTDRESARAKTIAFKNDDRKPSPIPLEECPWCGEKFRPASFQLVPNPDTPIDLRVCCVNRSCEFSRGNPLPILSVDEPIYRRLPCFIIATVDKFAAMPWTGEVGAFFGRVDRGDNDGFYGPCERMKGRALSVDRLLPPDLVIQDELHLISGPLGTMVGLYETALDSLSTIEIDGKQVRPKIVASTATVRRAESQIQSLFNHSQVDVFPPPGPDRRDSFFAKTHNVIDSNARMYVGIAAQGRSPKVVMLRVYLALLSAAKKAYVEAGGTKAISNPADSYMTLLGYFNSLRELGGARRLIEDEVRTQLTNRGMRKRVGEALGSFVDRTIAYEAIELTSRISTSKVSEAKRRLEQTFDKDDHVDIAIATNMISVGLDITRLGLMVVFGQPKTSAEYIQATSRVGRDHSRPGLVVTVLNIHKPRDRSHYERFSAFHESFYRSVEATSVTPFSPRALDRGLAGTLIALARHGFSPMTPPRGANEILENLPSLEFAVNALAQRAFDTSTEPKIQDRERVKNLVRDRSKDLLDEWCRIAKELRDTGGTLQYQTEVGSARRLLYEFLSPELKALPPRHKKFRANRSLRDVEPNVNLWLKTLDGIEIEGEEENDQ